MAKKPPNLADYVEAAERRHSPRRRRTRRSSDRGSRAVWLWVLVVAVLLIAGAVAFLHFKQLI